MKKNYEIRNISKYMSLIFQNTCLSMSFFLTYRETCADVLGIDQSWMHAELLQMKAAVNLVMVQKNSSKLQFAQI